MTTAALLSITAALVAASPAYIAAAPKRPSSPSALHATAGVFISYGVVADPVSHIVAERLTIWDAVSGKDEIFSVGPAARIDGLPISCGVQFMRFEHMCTQLPKKLEPGKTWLTLVFWDAPKPRNDLQIRDTYPGTDEIHTMLPPPPF